MISTALLVLPSLDAVIRAVPPPEARIVAVCDAFDALINDRPYRAAKTAEEAVATLLAGAGSQWDPEVVQAFVRDVPVRAHLGAA